MPPPRDNGQEIPLEIIYKKSVQGEPCLFAERFLMGAECLPGHGRMEGWRPRSSLGFA